MDITKDAVIQWLTQERRSYTWLAEKCGVTVQAVSNWLRESAPRPISATAQTKIRGLMEQDAELRASRPLHPLILEFPEHQFVLIEEAAVRQRKSPRMWARDTLLELAEMDAERVAAELVGNGTNGH